jgi:hypothetical protein
MEAIDVRSTPKNKGVCLQYLRGDVKPSDVPDYLSGNRRKKENSCTLAFFFSGSLLFPACFVLAASLDEMSWHNNKVGTKKKERWELSDADSFQFYRAKFFSRKSTRKKKLK